MSARAAALVLVALSLVLIGATVADWSVVEEVQSFEVEDDVTADPASPDGPPTGGTVEIPREETTSGARTAGPLLAVGLAGLVVAGLMVRWRWAAAATVVLAGVGAVVLVLGWPATGTTTAAPIIAGIALLGYPAVGLVVLRRQTSAGLPAAAGTDTASRYTVEAVRGLVSEDDEWDLATAPDDGPTDRDPATDPTPPTPPDPPTEDDR